MLIVQDYRSSVALPLAEDVIQVQRVDLWQRNVTMALIDEQIVCLEHIGTEIALLGRALYKEAKGLVKETLLQGTGVAVVVVAILQVRYNPLVS